MNKNYGHLEIDFLPDRILKKIYEVHSNQLPLIKGISTQILCDSTIYFERLESFIHYKQQLLLNLFCEHFDKLVV